MEGGEQFRNIGKDSKDHLLQPLCFADEGLPDSEAFLSTDGGGDDRTICILSTCGR